MTSSIRQEPLIALAGHDELLSHIQDRVLWLSMQIVHHANNVRANPDPMKVGGHQTSSASVVSILTSLFFEFMRPGDRIAIKPHASPVFHAIQYLLGNLDESYMPRLRDFHGLQAYPSRTKDPDAVDFSTGSVGLGSIAPNFASLSQEYLSSRFRSSPRRFISLVGDAELDEGTVWESIVEPQLAALPNVLWVIDLNRQSLDRIIPGIRVRMWRQMFAANGWRVIDAKYGAQLEAAFELPHGDLLRTSIDEMPNEMYQRLLRNSAENIREWLPKFSADPLTLKGFIGQWDDRELHRLVSNLGGHDFPALRQAFSEAASARQPSVVFAYTLKGWRLPSQGDPQNHQVLLSQKQMDALQHELGVANIWGGFSPDSPEGRLCDAKGEALRSGALPKAAAESQVANIAVPTEFGRPYSGQMSTQQSFGILLVDISRELPKVAERLVTASPDVASSTNLGGWINKVGVWNRSEAGPLPKDAELRALQWLEHNRGQHIELGISESNLFMLLGQLGLTHETAGEMLLPVGTLYDPFVCRALEALMYQLYAGSRFIVVGTPSGVTLSREGGAHQSFLTPSLAIGLPDLAYYEPCFGQELEWMMLDALKQLVERKRSTYLRLSTRRVDQRLAAVPPEGAARERMRLGVLSGGYRLLDRRAETGYAPSENVVHILASGTVVPEALTASAQLLEHGVFANVINVTSPGLLFQAYQKATRDRVAAQGRAPSLFADLIPLGERAAPIVTVMDGHPQALAWVGSAVGSKAVPLGVTGFGQSGSLGDIYREYGIDAASILTAALTALEG